MVNWKKALDQLTADPSLSGVANLASRSVGALMPDQVNQALSQVPGMAWDMTKAVGSEVLDSTHPKEWMGDLQYYIAKYGPDVVLDTFNRVGGDAVRAKDVLAAHEQGFNGRSGGRAVWELMQSDNPALLRGAADIAIDPTTWLTAGGASAGKALVAKGGERVAAGGVANAISGRALQGAGQSLKVATLPDKAMDKLATNVVGKAANTRVGQYLTGISPREKVRKELDTGFAMYKNWKMTSGSRTAQQGMQAASGMRITPMVAGADRPDRAAENAWNAIANRLPVTSASVGDRIFERGPFARMSSDAVAQQTWIDTMADKDFMANNQVAWPVTATPDDVEKVLSKLPEPTQTEARDIVQRWMALGIDPIHTSDEGAFKTIFKANLKSDPTIASMSEEANFWLFDNTFTGGKYKDKTYADALSEIEQEFVADKNTVINAVGKAAWKPGERIDIIESILSGDTKEMKAARKVWNKWSDEGVDVLTHPVEESAFSMFEQYVYGEAGVATARAFSWMGALAAVWKGQALLSPRYHASNVTSAWFNTILVNGFKGLASPVDFWNQVKLAIKADPNVYGIFAVSTINQTIEDYGLSRLNRNVAHSGLAAMESGVKRNTDRVFRRIVGQDISRGLGNILEKNRLVGVGVDAAARGKLWEERFTATFEERVPELMKGVIEAADKHGVSIAPDVSLMPFRDPEKLLGYYRGLGFSEGVARRLSRNVAEVINDADKAAIATVHKGMFSYYRTRTDEMLSKVVPFHYYASRSTALYFEEMARNPVLMVNMARLAEELFRDYENSGLNARQKGWLYVMSGPAGFSMLMNPDALLGFTRAVGLMGDNYDTDETQLGGILKWMKAGGYGLYPWVDGMFNMVGTYGDTFEPDMIGIRHRALIGSIVNAMSAEFGLGEAGMQAAPYAELNAKSREHISQWASALLPGWMSQPVRAKANDTGTIAEASMEKLIESRIIYNNPGMTYEQLFAIMNDPESDEYRKAHKEIARSGVANQLLSFTLPVGFKAREASTDVRSAVLGTTYDFADKLGMSASDVSPAADAEFAAKYKATTGKDWKPGDFDRAQMEQSLITATPQARPFILQLHQYNNLGSEFGRKAVATYNSILSGSYVPPGFGTPQKGMERDLADLWLRRQSRSTQASYMEVKNLQAMFRQVNPDFGQFKDWQGQMFYLQDLLGGSLAYYREQVSKNNPNAAAYFEAKKNDLLKKHKEPTKFIAAMDQATTSPDAWLAINGVAKKRADQAPMATSSNVPFDPASTMVDQYQTQAQPTQQDPWSTWLQGLT